jgi:hypothetical protein
MAKHKHREQSARVNETNNNNNKNIPFGIDPMQLMGLLGGNFDINNMGNMLSSMNTNGFNLGNLGSIAKMMGINLDNNLMQGTMGNQNSGFNKNLHTDINHSKQYNNMNAKSAVNQSVDKNIKKDISDKELKDNDENLQFLIALRNYVHPDRVQFIEKIIEAYRNGEFKDI